jgi:hypothetical protein
LGFLPLFTGGNWPLTFEIQVYIQTMERAIVPN